MSKIIRLLYTVASLVMSIALALSAVYLQELEADHSRPSSAEFNSEWIYNSNPPYTFITCTAINLLYILWIHFQTRVF
jgi:hypothetical protein